jgi:hypothetical protein
MRLDPENWKLGIIYYCPEDPRIVVRQILPVGWTWNFGHRLAIPAICLTVIFLFTPVITAWWLGVHSKIVLLIILVVSLSAIVIVASRAAKDPGL